MQRINVFLAVSELKNFTRAAEKLHLTQPAVSHVIKSLEEDYGCRFFHRDSREVRLTAEGKIFYVYAKTVSGLNSSLRNELAMRQSASAPLLHIAVSYSIGEYYLNKIVTPFTLRYPNVQMKLFVGYTYDVINQLLRSESQLGIIEGDCDNDQLTVEEIIPNELVLVVSPNHPLAVHARISKEQLRHVPLILRDQTTSNTRLLIEKVFRQHHIEPNIHMILSSNQAIKSAVEAGLGAAILSRITLEKELSLGVLKEIDIEGISFRRPIQCVYKKDPKNNRLVRDLLAILGTSNQAM